MYQKCNCHEGDEALYYKDSENCAFIDSKGEMLVTIGGKSMKFNVKVCPKCGHKFIMEKLVAGTKFYYVDDTMTTPDDIIRGEVDFIYNTGTYFDVIFKREDCDFDEYESNKEAIPVEEWGVFFFPDKEDAIEQLENFKTGNLVYDDNSFVPSTF